MRIRFKDCKNKKSSFIQQTSLERDLNEGTRFNLRIFVCKCSQIMESPKAIRRAEFSPKIKTYVMLYVGFLLFVTIIGIPILFVWLLGLGQYTSRRYYQNLKCLLTDRHLIFSKGAFYKVEKTIPLENIQDLTFLENPILNLLEMRILKIETAGGGGSTTSDMKLVGILDAEGFKEKVLEQRESLRMKTEHGQTGELRSDETLEVLKEIRDLLKNANPKYGQRLS